MEPSDADLISTLRKRAQAAEATAESYRQQLRTLADATFHVVLEGNATDHADIGAIDVDAASPDTASTLHSLMRTQAGMLTALREAQATGEPVSIALRDGPTESWTGTVRPCSHPEPAHSDAQNDAVQNDAAQTCLHGVLRRTPHAAQPDMEPLHRELLELLPDAILIVASNDRIKYANSAAVSMTGAPSLEALLGTSLWKYIPEQAQPSVSARRKQVRTGSCIDFTRHTLRTQNGEERSVESASVPMVYQGRHAALIAVRDLTGRDRLSENLARTLSLFDTAFHLGPAAAILRLRDGLILEVSERMESLTGSAASDLTGEFISNVSTGLSGYERRRLAHSLRQRGRIDDRELTLHDASGRARTVLLSARLIVLDRHDCALVSLVDITERKRALVQAQETQTLMQKIFRMSPSPLAIFRLSDGVYLNANDAMCTLVKRPRYDIVGRTDGDMALWKNANYRMAVVNQLRETQTVNDVQATFCQPDGTRIDVLCSLQRISVDDEPCAVIAITDITQREAARRALVEAKEKAEDVAQFRSSVLSNITHEMRTPLTVILGFTPTLREGIDSKYRRFVDLIERSGRRLLFTLDSLLDLAQLEAGTLTPDLSPHPAAQIVKQKTISARERAREKGLETRIDVQDEPLYMQVDPDLLERVLQHVLDNAIKFTESGRITLTVAAEPDCVVIHIADTGSGIDPAFVPRAFDAFTQESDGLARTHQGSGLGLTVCKHIMERLNGSIDINTKKGEGSTITLRVPRTDGPTST